ncbi:DHH family phosphoesterase [Trichothermofontia sichuanensis B231]|uniref:single-stranded-DNA-specific exonuclease RecJ n=1 Tax=Trichothermofontia sichuanensis TaxID=3045816 RepID=UPI002247F25B|nr:DHH family phosphoesterase [Trichothermofontia sichuanensis]UZQ54557.1 DHH family phosphoesterase [Trichothermofontia sichuanensis B231]
MSTLPPAVPPLRLPRQRWQLAPAQPERRDTLATATGLPPLLAQVLLNRGILTPAEAIGFLEPDAVSLPSPLTEFPDLALSLDLLATAIAQKQLIAICGDYDADGMTSTALLLRAFKAFNANVHFDIPSRMAEGYGLNERIVEDFYQLGVQIILTVDNGIAAHAPIALARELGLTVIVTDHHDLPPELPQAHAILNPKLLPATSPYRGLAGVGVAYVLALELAKKLQKKRQLEVPLLELFTLGTIADLAPLTGVNRCWVKQGLKLLPNSQLVGIQALINQSGIHINTNGSEHDYLNGNDQGDTVNNNRRANPHPHQNSASLKPEDIGFRLGPRINAVGRIGEPPIVIELLTTDDPEIAAARAAECEAINQRRKDLCAQYEAEAIAWVETQDLGRLYQQERVLVVVRPGWHHGVIGIVASRLVERYGVPVFIGTYEGENDEMVRGSARSIPEFHVFEALEFCKDLTEKHGGHQAAGGFSLKASHLPAFRQRLQTFACQCLQPEHLKPLIAIDAQANFADLTVDLATQIDRLHPCGIDNPEPLFWTPNVQVLEQRLVGQGQNHLQLTLAQVATDTTTPDRQLPGLVPLKAIAWRWGDFFPLPKQVDIAYRIGLNYWNNQTTVKLELIGVRLPNSVPKTTSTSMHSPANPLLSMSTDTPTDAPVDFYYRDRHYRCRIIKQDTGQELRIRNQQGHVLSIIKGQKIGYLTTSSHDCQEVDVSQPFFFHLIKAAKQALQMKNRL